MVDIILILSLGGLSLILTAKNEVLKQENKGLRDRMNFDRKWHEIDKNLSIELARSDERFKMSMENYEKFCKRIEKVLEE